MQKKVSRDYMKLKSCPSNEAVDFLESLSKGWMPFSTTVITGQEPKHIQIHDFLLFMILDSGELLSYNTTQRTEISRFNPIESITAFAIDTANSCLILAGASFSLHLYSFDGKFIQ